MNLFLSSLTLRIKKDKFVLDKFISYQIQF